MRTLCYKSLVLVVILLKQCQSNGNINNVFEQINGLTAKFNAIAAEIAWESSVNPGNPDLPAKAADYQQKRILWQHKICSKLVKNTHLLNNMQGRQTYLLCRGPIYSFDEARKTSSIYEELQTIYTNSLICIPSTKNNTNITDVEDAILKYLSAVEQYLNNDRFDYIAVAAKYVGNSDVTQGLCMRGEPDLERLMTMSRDERVLRWVWSVWREKVGPPMKKPYRELVDIENLAARRNGYHDIGEAWRAELEVPNLRLVCRRLYAEIQPLYNLLHGVTRFFLRRSYGDVVPKTGPIPAHLLGNMWSQNWESLADLIVPASLDLDKSIKKQNWTVNHMVNRAEDFYQSLGLQPLPDTFWRKSVFGRNNESTRCHGAAADMFQDSDVRILYCSGTSIEDFYVLHHELGHIHYFMAYKDQPALFRQANAAFHESIGDTIMHGVMTPQHLHRLGLINDTILYTSQTSDVIEPNNVFNSEQKLEGNKKLKFLKRHLNINSINTETYLKLQQKRKVSDNDKGYEKKTTDYNDSESEEISISPDEVILLKQALNKLPQIPFSLLIDEYRWKYFEGTIDDKSMNEEFWKMVVELQGVKPPGVRGEEYFDIGAKFHVPDNTPYIRYFLSSFIQYQLFETLCKAAVFGHRGVSDPLPSTIPLHRCDIYGSKSAGKILKDIMSKGGSENWRKILKDTTGQDEITSSSLLRYYHPLLKLLTRLVRKYRIPIGW